MHVENAREIIPSRISRGNFPSVIYSGDRDSSVSTVTKLRDERLSNGGLVPRPDRLRDPPSLLQFKAS
jgi:hypothetical protein